jgi:hypothetical protein
MFVSERGVGEEIRRNSEVYGFIANVRFLREIFSQRELFTL